MILWDYRGTAAWGMFTDGAWARPYQMSGGQTACPTPGIGGTDRCVLMQWQVQQSAFDQARGNVQEVSWMGSLLRSKRDGTGLEYKRARVYDPRTGRFTQEDPIGLAGGLNLYGFANGDPVNFSDPFGLQGCPKYSFETPSGMCLSAPAALGAAITMAFQSAATAFRALRSGATAEGVAASRAGARNVGEQLAYQELAPGVAGNAGIEIAGGASKAQFRGAAAYAERYGGDASDWVKKSTTGSHAGSGGNVYQLHWVQNLRTGQIVDVKLKSYARMH
jgi:RHS repeat-associated protein